MKAIQISMPGGPEVLETIELPIPEPGYDEVLIRADSIGVGKPDVLMRTGVYRWSPPLPAILGNEMSGYIEKIGPGVKKLAVGQPVLVFGTGGGRYAEYNSVSTSLVTPLPDNINLEDAVSIPNYIIAWAMLFEAACGINPNIAYVNGASGGVGTAIIDICKSQGIDIIGGTSSDKKCEFISEFGATHTINYAREDVVKRVLDFTDGKGVELVFDHLIGGRFTDTLDMLMPLGMIISFNALSGMPDEELFSAMRKRAAKSLAVRCFSWHCYDDNLQKRKEIIESVVERFAQGELNPPLYKRLALAEARLAHEILDRREVRGKIILKP